MNQKRHPFHALCPYFAMFPEAFARYHIQRWSRAGEWIFDPFSGRGTTVFEGLLNNRAAAGCDTNPVAACVSQAKANPPILKEVLKRIEEIKDLKQVTDYPSRNDEFFRHCFHRDTLKQIETLRANLKWRVKKVDCFIAALALGALHGESHRSANYFSNRMPRTISTKPDYSVRWWKSNHCLPPKRDVYDILKRMIVQRYAMPLPELRGRVRLADARDASRIFEPLRGKVALVVTSPPYFDVTNFQEDQWLRRWFLGGPPSATREDSGDDRHRDIEQYWQFLTEAWMGVRPLLRKDAILAIRIGGRIDKDDLRAKLHQSIERGAKCDVRMIGQGKTSTIEGGQLRAFRPGAKGTRLEHDFVFRLSGRQ